MPRSRPRRGAAPREAARERAPRRSAGGAGREGGLVAALYDEFYAVVRRIPRGRVLTYGQVAELAGHPGAARAAGAAMRASTGRGLPWQRVVGGSIQRALLEKEGVVFTPAGYIPLSRFGGAIATRAPRRPTRSRGRR